jgi:ATP-dependent RNA helicase DeaD
VEQDLVGEGVARSQHVVHVLPSDDRRIAGIVRTQVERLTSSEERPGIRLLVLTPTAGEAATLARDVNDGLDASGPLLTPLTTETRAARRVALGSACVVAPASLALALVKRSLLKLDRIETLVLMSLDVLAVTASEAMEAILTETPRTADRVAITAEINPAIDSVIERHARKARRVQHDLPSPSAAVMEYIVCDERVRTDVLGRLFDTIDPPHATLVATEDDAEEACSALARLGYGPDDELVEFSDGETPEDEALVVVFGAPQGPDDLASILDATPQRLIILVEPQDVTAFLRVFGARARPVSASTLVEIAGSMEDAIRGEIRGMIGSTSMHREVLTLAPLFADRDPVEVAAALLRMYEQSRSDARTGAVAPPVRVVTARIEATERDSRESFVRRDERPARPRREERTDEGAHTAIYINVGSRDGAQKGDFVGAIAGESGISSDQIGRINLRETFTIVEIATGAVEQVLAAINGKTIRGRIIAARPDRMGDEGPLRGRSERSEERFDRGEGRSSDRDRSSGARGRPSTGRGAPAGRGGAGARGAGGSRGAGARGTGEARSGGARGAGTSRGAAGARGGRPASGPRREGRDDAGGPRSFRDNDRGRGPRAIRESREWGERGERLRNARRPRRERDE